MTEVPDLFGVRATPADAHVIPLDAFRDFCAGAHCKVSIWWLVSPTGERFCVDVQGDGLRRPIGTKAGLGRPHLDHCPDWKASHG